LPIAGASIFWDFLEDSLKKRASTSPDSIEKPKSDTEMKAKKEKSNQKPKLNITLPEITKQKLTALAQLEKRSVSNLIEIMADERWEALAEREGIDYAKAVAEIAGLKGLNADKEADRKVFRREILERLLKYKKK